MAYNKLINRKSGKEVKYLSKDFNSFKNQLIEFTKTYFPNNFNDFSEGNPAMMFLEMAAYVGDILSFYTDTQIQETFLTLAQDKENLYNMAYALGYKPKATSTSNVTLRVSQLVPSKLKGGVYVEDWDYALELRKNSTFSSTEGPTFYLSEDLNFHHSSSMNHTTSSVAQYAVGSGNVEYFLIEKNVRAVSGVSRTQTFSIGAAEKFKTLTLFDTNIIKVESIIDSEGNEWEEVDYLAQDTKFEEVANNETNDPFLHTHKVETPYLMRVKQVPKRFITRIKPNNQMEIQFGAGVSSKSDEFITPSPDNIGLGIKEGRNDLDKAYDPSNFLYTKSYGQAPSNTVLTVTYKVGGGLSSNVGAHTITNVGSLIRDIKPGLSAGMANYILSTVTSTNPLPASGGGDGDSIEDLRLNSIANFSTQKRAVTREDYMIRALSLPPQFGGIAKTFIEQDDQSSILITDPNRIPNPLALNLYTLGYDSQKKLTLLNEATKQNLVTYLEQYRMLTDAINIKNAYIINIGIEFEITSYKNFNNEKVILDVIEELTSYFNIDKWQINQPIIISDVVNCIAGIRGVQTVENIKFKNKYGTASNYSISKYSLEGATRNGVIYPSKDPSIFELKFPSTDILGQITTY